MGRVLMLLVLASALLATVEAVSTTTEEKDIKMTGGPNKRFLRTTGMIDDAAGDEERWFQASLLGKLSKVATKAHLPKTAKNVQFRAWLNAKWNPNDLYTHFRLAGKERAVLEKDPNFLVWLEYSHIWLAKGGRHK